MHPASCRLIEVAGDEIFNIKSLLVGWTLSVKIWNPQGTNLEAQEWCDLLPRGQSRNTANSRNRWVYRFAIIRSDSQGSLLFAYSRRVSCSWTPLLLTWDIGYDHLTRVWPFFRVNWRRMRRYPQADDPTLSSSCCPYSVDGRDCCCWASIFS